jgi:hypothetical protein
VIVQQDAEIQHYGGEWSVSHPCRFNPREGAPGTHWIGGCVDPRAGLDAVNRKILHCWESNQKITFPCLGKNTNLIEHCVLN